MGRRRPKANGDSARPPVKRRGRRNPAGLPVLNSTVATPLPTAATQDVVYTTIEDPRDKSVPETSIFLYVCKDRKTGASKDTSLDMKNSREVELNNLNTQRSNEGIWSYVAELHIPNTSKRRPKDVYVEWCRARGLARRLEAALFLSAENMWFLEVADHILTYFIDFPELREGFENAYMIFKCVTTEIKRARLDPRRGEFFQKCVGTRSK